MPITLEKSWTFNVNNELNIQDLNIDANNTFHRRILLALVAQLKAFSWTVVGSSDGTTAGMDAVDRWVTATDLDTAVPPSVHSWIVLENPATGMQLRFDLNQPLEVLDEGAKLMNRDMSPGGLFTGGDTTAAPTATDQGNNKDMDANEVSVFAHFNNSEPLKVTVMMHSMQSTDGKLTYIFLMDDYLCEGTMNQVEMCFLAGEMEDLFTGMNRKFFTLWGFVSVAQLTHGLIGDSNGSLAVQPFVVAVDDVGTIPATLLGEVGYFDGAVSENKTGLITDRIGPNDFDAHHQLHPVRLASMPKTANGFENPDNFVIGRIPDIYLGQEGSSPAWKEFPSTAPRLLIQIGSSNLVVPWPLGITPDTTYP